MRRRRGEPGLRELGFLFGAFYFAQGVGEPTSGLTAQPIQSLLRGFGNDPATIAGFVALLSLPWTIKPLYGLLTDLVPFLGMRRRSYLLASLATAAAGLLFAGSRAFEAGDERALVWILLAPAIGLAFADVVIDALMVETAQPRGWTGRIQSVQWGSIYAAGMLAGVAGGWLSQTGRHTSAFTIAGGVILLSLGLALLRAREPEVPASGTGEAETGSSGGAESSAARLAALRAALGDRALWCVGGLIVLLAFNPFSSTVLYLYATEQLAFSEQYYGALVSLLSGAAIAGAIGYGIVCRRVSFIALVRVSIVLAVGGTLAYALLSGPSSSVPITVLAGVTTMIATLAQLDLAARVCPPAVAGTAFAALMSLSNLSTALSTALGGWLYGTLGERYGEPLAFDLIVGIGATCTASGFLLIPALRRYAGPRLEPSVPEP